MLKNFISFTGKIFLLVFIFNADLALAENVTADTRVLSTNPKEIYGNVENIKIRIGNGSAGQSGLLRALAEDYLKISGKKYGIAWYQNISINALKQLKLGTVDIVMVYEREQAAEPEKEGWATHHTTVFNDHFLIVGPRRNPADLDESDSPQVVFTKIAELGEKKSQNKSQKSHVVFLSRDDNSGTNIKEKSIWTVAGFKPWLGDKSWYLKYPTFPKDALLYAGRKGLYTITDLGTWLSNRNELTDSEIFVSGGKSLLNPCFALLGKKPSKEAMAFLQYLKSDHAQQLIAGFGKEKYDGQPLFTPAQQIDF